jgi:hypothetical protein
MDLNSLQREDIERERCPICGAEGMCVQLSSPMRAARNDYHAERKLAALARIEELRNLVRIQAEQIEILLRELNRIEGFTIKQLGDPMALTPIAPGNSPQFTATPVPATAVPSTPPTWTSSDTANAPFTVDSTGLVATVAISSTATVGASFTLTVSYTNADGTVATGSITETIVAPPSPDITSFTVAQTA